MVNRYVKRCSISKWMLHGSCIASMAASFVTCVDHTPHWNQFAKIKEILVQRLSDTFVINFLFEFGQDDFDGQMLLMMEE